MARDDIRTSTRSNEEVHNHRKQKIFVPTAKGEVLEKVLKFCEHYVRDPMTDLSVLPMAQSTNDHKNKLADLGLQEWYVSFIDVDQPVLDRLYMVAKYMDIEPLLYLTMDAIRVFVSNNPGSQWMLGSYEE